MLLKRHLHSVLIAAAAIFLPALALAADMPLGAPASADLLVGKVRAVALAMQRKSWEQGVLATAFLESGDDTQVVQMARASLICPDKNGLVAALGGAPVDPLMLGESLWHAAKGADAPEIRQAGPALLCGDRKGVFLRRGGGGGGGPPVGGGSPRARGEGGGKDKNPAPPPG